MWLFIGKRILATIPVMLVVALVVFLMLRLAPGDPAVIIAGDYATPDRIAAIRAGLGLDKPMPVQFALWLWGLLHGDLGISIFTNLPVSTLIAQRLEPTAILSLATIVFSALVAVPLGIFAAWRQGSWGDRGVMMLSVVGFSVPVFVTAYLMIWGFSLNLKWLPVQGYRSPFADFPEAVRHLILPVITLSAVYIALIARMTRAAILEVLGEDYIRTARAKGQAERKVLLVHALGNAAVPIVTVIGLGIGLLIGGVVVTETVYNIPGLGRLVVDAVHKRDYPIIQGLILFFSFLYILLNLIIDIIYTMVDPRIRY